MSGPANAAPTPAQQRSLNQIKRIFHSSSTPDIASAKTLVPRAISGNPSTLEPIRNAIKRPQLSAATKLEFLEAALPEADKVMARLFGPNCFEKENQVYGHYWRVNEARSYLRLVLEAGIAASEAGEWDKAVEYSKRVLELNHGDNNGIRDRVPVFLMEAGNPLEAYNFCLSWLDTQHETYDSTRYCPKDGYAQIDRYALDDLKKDDPISIKIQNLGHASLIFNAALSAFKLLGNCTLAVSWLREGNKANSHVISILLKDPASWPTAIDPNPRGLGSTEEASDYVFYAGNLWKDPEVQEWVKSTADEVTKRECSNMDCRKVEQEKGEYKLCANCLASWYCGKECQEADWKSGHKRRCKEERNIRELTEKMGKGMQWGK